MPVLHGSINKLKVKHACELRIDTEKFRTLGTTRGVVDVF